MRAIENVRLFWYKLCMVAEDAELIPATIVVRPWGRHGLWLAMVLDGSAVLARLVALSEDTAFKRACEWAAPRAVNRAHWIAIPEPRGTVDNYDDRPRE